MPPHRKALEWRVCKTTEQLLNPSQRWFLATCGGSRPPGGNDQMEHLREASNFRRPHPGRHKEPGCIRGSSFLVQACQVSGGNLGCCFCFTPGRNLPDLRYSMLAPSKSVPKTGSSCVPQATGLGSPGPNLYTPDPQFSPLWSKAFLRPCVGIKLTQKPGDLQVCLGPESGSHRCLE